MVKHSLLLLPDTSPASIRGFTLIELSIVLVIIGLLVGGVIVGKDLITHAALRSQMSQIDEYRASVKAFQIKYNCLPGDCSNAPNFGFAARSRLVGRGDGNGFLSSIANLGSGSCASSFSGEHILFWRDLSDAKLIRESFTTATENGTATVSLAQVPQYLPKAKITSAYISVFCGGSLIESPSASGGGGGDGNNYFGIAATSGGVVYLNLATAAMSPSDAFMIDTKMDDGFPQSGAVLAIIGYYWAAGTGDHGANDPTTTGPVTANSSPAVSTPATDTTCYDNGNSPNATMIYSVGYQGGRNINCGLAIKF